MHVFRFTNSGTKPVVVERVGVTCGCMKPTFSQAPVLPGGSGEIGIAYDPADRPGAFDKAVYVYTDGSRMMPLRIRGSVKRLPTAFPWSLAAESALALRRSTSAWWSSGMTGV